ncbi:uncharacterized protein C8Q71DRAFT_245603 [Rhodofomes roseus]|uniref:Uncharacterized protein n=1 Tax=Rhodofomes roseus TaxID=34475 RepID=A0ABQ8K877_9APHY|nr:uncharacterized protein C8Q71DRAFT_245603 [Rhodofomes roseus]KAH9832951.1 hypothetical protein C8Q71DRAFT_245603 [Rhodofomes roseus]
MLHYSAISATPRPLRVRQPLSPATSCRPQHAPAAASCRRLPHLAATPTHRAHPPTASSLRRVARYAPSPALRTACESLAPVQCSARALPGPCSPTTISRRVALALEDSQEAFGSTKALRSRPLLHIPNPPFATHCTSCLDVPRRPPWQATKSLCTRPHTLHHAPTVLQHGCSTLAPTLLDLRPSRVRSTFQTFTTPPLQTVRRICTY